MSQQEHANLEDSAKFTLGFSFSSFKNNRTTSTTTKTNNDSNILDIDEKGNFPVEMDRQDKNNMKKKN